MAAAAEETVGVLLAGGQSRRMGGGDKSLQRLGGVPILARVIDRVAPQVDRLILNANGDPARFASFGLPVVPDSVSGHPGPLAGVLAGMEWAAAEAPGCRWILTAPTDAPFLPLDLVQRLTKAVSNADMACSATQGRAHPVVGLWPVALRHDLRAAVTEEGIRKVDVWTARYRCAALAFDAGPPDPFFNVNSPEDLAEAERLLGRAPFPTAGKT